MPAKDQVEIVITSPCKFNGERQARGAELTVSKSDAGILIGAANRAAMKGSVKADTAKAKAASEAKAKDAAPAKTANPRK